MWARSEKILFIAHRRGTENNDDMVRHKKRRKSKRQKDIANINWTKDRANGLKVKKK